MRNYDYTRNQINQIFDKEFFNKQERWIVLNDIIKELILVDIEDIYKSHKKTQAKS